VSNQATSSFGYLKSVSQPCITFQQLMPDMTLRLDCVDFWLDEHLEAAELATQEADVPGGDDHGLHICHRALRLYGEVLRAGWIPIFSPGSMQVVQTPDGRKAVRIVLPVFDGFSGASFIDLYRRCFQLVTTDLARDPQPASVENVHLRINGLIETIKRGNPLGNSAMPLCRIAHDADIPFRHVSRGLIQFGWGSKAMTMRHAIVGSDSAVGTGLSRSKQQSAQIMAAAGYPAPEHALVGSLEEARRQAEKLGWPLVVKPNDCACSDGVTVDIGSDQQLAAAFAHARSKSSAVLVEKQIAGACHRVMIVGGELAYAVRRHPKSVIGDGKSRIRDLVDEANRKEMRRPPWRRFKPFEADAEALISLARAGFNLDSIPAEGALAPLRPINSHEFGGTVEDVAPTIHPDNVKLAADVARLLGLQIAGVDLMSPDVAVPWHANGGVVLEVNAGPDFMEAKRTIRAECVTPVLADGNGRIPVHLLMGASDLQTVASQLSIEGRTCHILGEDFYFEKGERQPLRLRGLLQRAVAVLARPHVDSLLIVDEGMALLRSGYPVDRIETLFIAQRDERKARGIEDAVAARVAVSGVEYLGMNAANAGSALLDTSG
jgi:cyanophycin synthetase